MTTESGIALLTGSSRTIGSAAMRRFAGRLDGIVCFEPQGAEAAALVLDYFPACIILHRLPNELTGIILVCGQLKRHCKAEIGFGLPTWQWVGVIAVTSGCDGGHSFPEAATSIVQ